MAWKTGRKRKVVSRYKCGKPKPMKLGPTPETLAKKQALVGAGGDPVLASTVVGIMRARGLIDATQESHLADFARLYTFRHGNPMAGPGGKAAVPLTDEQIERKVKRWREVDGTLDTAQHNALRDAAVLEIMPPWMARKIAGRSRVSRISAKQKAFFDGLRALGKLWGRRRG